jgi:hypothetical protein
MERKKPYGTSKNSLTEVLGIILKPSLTITRKAKHDFFKPKLKPPSFRLKKLKTISEVLKPSSNPRSSSIIHQTFSSVLTVKSKPLENPWERYSPSKLLSQSFAATTKDLSKTENFSSKSRIRTSCKSSNKKLLSQSQLKLEGW